MGQGDLNWWERRATVVALTLLAMVPLLWPTIPPLVDLPGHMGSYRVELDGGRTALRQFYEFHWSLIGNLGVDLLIVPMSKIFGLELGVKLIVMAIPALTVAGLLWIAREVHGRIPPTAMFALPLAYGHPFLFGYVNFSLSMALALVAFALWLWLGRHGQSKRRAGLFVFIAPVVWLTHKFGWGLLVLLVFSAEASRQKDGGRDWASSFVRAGLTCLLLALPVFFEVLAHKPGGGGGTGLWFDWSEKLAWIKLIFHDRWALLDIGSVVALGGLLVYAVVSPKLQFSRTLGIAALFLLAVYICMPRIVSGLAIYGDLRLAPFMLAIAVIAIGPRPAVSQQLLPMLAMIGLVFFAGRMAINTASLGMAAERQDRAFAALDHVPEGARVVAFTQAKWADRLAHISALAIVRKRAFSNDQWNLGDQGLLRVIKKDAPGFSADPSQYVTANDAPDEGTSTIDAAIARFPRDAFDYLWLIEPPFYDSRLTGAMIPVWRDGNDVLFRIEHE